MILKHNLTDVRLLFHLQLFVGHNPIVLNGQEWKFSNLNGLYKAEDFERKYIWDPFHESSFYAHLSVQIKEFQYEGFFRA